MTSFRKPLGFPDPMARVRSSTYRNGTLMQSVNNTMGIGMSVIKPDESQGMLTPQEAAELFGPTEFKPDTVKIPFPDVSADGGAAAGNGGKDNDDHMILERPQVEQTQGEFRIERGFAGMDRAQIFQVVNPEKAKDGDHIVYTVNGVDRLGRFEIYRRYSEFHTLREIFVDRWPGLYIPPLPEKQSFGNLKAEFIEERRFLLNMFMRQMARCPYLCESDEFFIFVRPNSDNLQRELLLMPRLSPESHLIRIQAYYSFMGTIGDSQITA